ncbi:plant cysteine oxidase 3-like [Mangifera indica]|uniref:plant cysteine oxidase 3-like n=1 Tax=Mangifera indica TaxID=29780 RepID=UPI001CFC2FB7|nr:plant cysteine oxidase 3-like [Mangifera indica]
MLSNFQKASGKARIFLQNKTLVFTTCLRKQLHMAKKTSSSSKIQTLYDLCRKNFTPSGSPPPSSQAIHGLCSFLDTVGPVDVGLKEESQDDDRGLGIFGLTRLNGAAQWAQPITYLDIYECDSFTMCIFCFPTSSVIPLHDHPGMTVFSKVLYGSVHVKAYDWTEPACFPEVNRPGSRPVRLAKLAVDRVLTAECETAILYPKSGGNLHCFTAVTPCAVLDILTPPYKEDASRKCTYYIDYPYSNFAAENGAVIIDRKEDYAWLAETGTPDDLYMRSGVYAGPTIQV